jgi:DNA-binding transcriptional LysR family regulator
MDLRHIRTFATVARVGNLTRAAERLHITQPAVSLQLKHLQDTLQLTLFARGASGLALTADGHALLAAAERVLASMDDFNGVSHALRQTLSGSLTIGTILDPEFIRLGSALQSLVQTHPAVHTTLHHGMSGWVARQVAGGALDVGFTLGPPAAAGPALCSLPLAEFNYRVIAPRGWGERAAARSWRELAALPWIWTPPDSVHHRLLTRKFKALGVTPIKVAEVDQEASMLDLVRSGVGLSLARDSVALHESQANGLVLVKGLSIRTELSFLTLAARRHEAIVDAAFAAVQNAFR